MKKVFGKNEASYIGKKNTVILIVSILAVAVVIGAAMQPVMAGELSIKENESAATGEECLPCKAQEKIKKEDTKCKTCSCAASHAVKYMINHVHYYIEKNWNETGGYWLLLPMDVSLLMFQGIVQGWAESGFTMDIDYDDLREHINKTVDELVGQQLFPVTKLLASLPAIAIAITTYLLELCNGGDDEAKSLPATTQQTQSFSRITPRFYLLIRILHFLGLYN